jgi:dodecin
MTIARVTEVTASSKNSFEDAVRNGVERASKTLKNVSSAWVKDQDVSVKNGKVTEYRVKLKITFVLEE